MLISIIIRAYIHKVEMASSADVDINMEVEKVEERVEDLARLLNKKTSEIEQVAEFCTKMAVGKVFDDKVLKTARATKYAIEYVGTKNVSIEERLMYQDIDVHETVRMLSFLIHEYADEASGLEWMAQICLRELCKLEKRTREEVVVTHLKILGSMA